MQFLRDGRRHKLPGDCDLLLPSVRRGLFCRWAKQLDGASPQCYMPPLPLPYVSHCHTVPACPCRWAKQRTSMELIRRGYNVHGSDADVVYLRNVSLVGS